MFPLAFLSPWIHWLCVFKSFTANIDSKVNGNGMIFKIEEIAKHVFEDKTLAHIFKTEVEKDQFSSLL